MVATATAHRVGSISIIRSSGERVLEIALKLNKGNELYPRYTTFTKLFNQEGEFLNEVIVIYFKAPSSLTDKDIIEFQVHGGFSVSEILLEELISLGVRLAEPGESSKRACLRGEMSPLRALNIQDLILAKSTDAVKIVAGNMQGSLGELLGKIRTGLAKTLAFVKTSINYADDDLLSDSLEQISTMYEENSRVLKEIYTLSESKKELIEDFEITIVGKPSVGKSSPLNTLFSYKKAIVSDIARTTRDTIEESFKLGTHLLCIADTAGIRGSKDKIEQIDTELDKRSIEDAGITLTIFDNPRKKDEEDKNVFKLLSQSDKEIFYPLNRSDLETQFDKPCDVDLIELSVQNDIQILKEKLEKYLNSLDSDGFLVSSIALINAYKISNEAVLRTKELLSESSLELFASKLNLAIGELARFTKDSNRNEILDEIFGNFCLGK